MSAAMFETFRSPFGGESAPRTLIELVQYRARRQPGEIAYTFLDESGAVAATVSYQELERRARSIAAALQQMRAPGERALLLYGPGLDFHAAFLGCLYAGVIAVPANPPRVNRNFERLLAVIADADARFILTTSALLSRLQLVEDQPLDVSGFRWLATETLDTSAEDWREAGVTPDALAFLQYTSGSTGTPRGVRLTHRNLLHNAQLVYEAGRHTSADKYVSWLPTFHDMGFMVGMLEPLYAGIPAVLMSPASFLQSPWRWLQAVTDHQATLSGGPNFAYRLCVSRISPEQRAALNLERWRVAFNGAEPVRAQTLDDFAAAFARHGFNKRSFYPCYGLAETTLMVSGGGGDREAVRKCYSQSALERHRVVEVDARDPDSTTLVSSGRVLGGQKVAIVDPHSHTLCHSDQVGEIWVCGPSVADGYWNRAEQNQSVFGARLEPTGEGPFLRTGDLGFFRDGELYVTGRLKDLIIIRGANHYPQDIEQTVESVHPALRAGCAAAFSIDVEGEERLVIVQEVERHEGLDLDHLMDLIRQGISQRHELQAHAIVLLRKGTIPKTSSGKIQRHACKAAFSAGTLREVARDSLEDSAVAAEASSLILKTLLAIPAVSRQPPLEVYLQEQVARLLKVPARRLANDLPLTTFGLDSLNAVELKNAIECDLRVPVSLSHVLEGASISALARDLVRRLSVPPEGKRQAGHALLPADELPLSHMQQSLWLTHQLAPTSPAYNVTVAVQVEASIDLAALRQALQEIVDRHASLRTTVVASTAGPRQIIQARQDVTFEVVRGVAQQLDEAMIELAHRPFDLERGPIFRAAVFTRSESDHTLLLMAHHLVTDGRSMWILLEEVLTLYRARAAGRADSLPRLRSDYAEFVRWQAEVLDGPEGEALWSYWSSELEQIPTLDFPMARRRPPVRTFNGAEVRFSLDRELTQELRRLALSNHTTMYVVLLSVFEVLLHRYTGADDIVVGSPVQARPGAEFEGIAGCFFNVVLLRSDISSDPPFGELLAQTRRKVLGALEHQHYPSHLLAQRLPTERDPSRSPLFQVSFIFQKPMPGLFEDRRIKLVPIERRFARNDLELEILEAQDSLLGSLQFNTDLFQPGDMARFTEHYRQLLLAAIATPTQRVSQLSMSSEVERQQIQGRWSKGEGGYSQAGTIAGLFAAQVARNPGKLAAIHGDRSRTFAQLDDDAGRLATLIEILSATLSVSDHDPQ